jgi:hypothetical protein
LPKGKTGPSLPGVARIWYTPNDFRRRYIDALQMADAGDLGPLLAFARP